MDSNSHRSALKKLFCDYTLQCVPLHQSLVLLGSLPWLLSQAFGVDSFPAQTYLKLFLPSRSAAITSTGSVLPVTFCISGSCDSISDCVFSRHVRGAPLTLVLMNGLCCCRKKTRQ